MTRNHPDKTLSEMIKLIQRMNTSDPIELMMQAIAQWQEAEKAAKVLSHVGKRSEEIRMDFVLDDQNAIENEYPGGKSFAGDPPDPRDVLSDGKDWAASGRQTVPGYAGEPPPYGPEDDEYYKP